MFGVLFPIVFIVGGWLAIFAGVRRMQRRYGVRRSAAGPGGPVVVARGGARVGWLSATWPLAVLRFDESSAELRVLPLPPVLISRDEVIRVSRHGWGAGLRFETASGQWDHIMFAAKGAGDALRELGWPVEPGA